MRFTLTLVAGPLGAPITLADAKRHVRQDQSTDDAYITSLIDAASSQVESDTQRQLLTATWQAVYEAFPSRTDEALEIPLPPLQSVTSVQYLDEAGVLQTWPSTDYLVEVPAGPRAREARLAPRIAKSYPATAVLPGAVRLQFVAGYGQASAVPEPLKQAMRLLIGEWYARREASGGAPALPAYDALIAPFRRTTAVLA